MIRSSSDSWVVQLPVPAKVARGPSELSSHKGFPFRWALPLGQLVLCALLLWPVRPRIALALHLTALAEPPLAFRLNETGWMFTRWAETNSMKVVAALNIPVGLLQIPYVVVSSDKNEWTPPGIDLFVWRAMVWPILGMLFWWIAGRGAEALAAARQKRLTPPIHWLEMIVGLLLLAMGVLLFLVFALNRPRDDPSDLWFLPMAILWAFLGSLSVAGRVLQWRLRKRQQIG
jgi:hypothetical protein